MIREGSGKALGEDNPGDQCVFPLISSHIQLQFLAWEALKLRNFFVEDLTFQQTDCW